MAKHLALDEQARAHLAKLRSVPLSAISQSEYVSYLPTSRNETMASVIGGKRKIDNAPTSNVVIILFNIYFILKLEKIIFY